ncbi:hypothetical protein BDV26DRAFT_91926 [Aspergillus bertholletiae]|uniref:Uncharacterized protein n=1 Tax=Aspergillus bertholletiae TaxID=1226010 RepID=A0A5N7BNW6_9EURO|nr:hypothetical protein BDV26DRAFT_91926 [Aspergillus bertholletiae]
MDQSSRRSNLSILCFYLFFFLCPAMPLEGTSGRSLPKASNLKLTGPEKPLSGIIPAMAERLNHRRIGLRLP